MKVSPTAASSTEEVRQIVLSAGFDRVGFATAREAPDAGRLSAWLESGFAADMGYLARNAERRRDPRRVVPEAKTVISVALHYRGSQGQSADKRPAKRASISSYAQGIDYHRVLQKRLQSVSRRLCATFPGHTFRYYVDTGPVLERSWAQQAGIGWIGKNACAIDSQRGSYFFIGTIITTVSLIPDAPAANQCGSCRLCLDACPTDAFAAPYRLDSRRCISYLTIENRGSISQRLRSSMGSMVFGCDICQEVCPFNRSRPLRGDEELAPRQENLFPQLGELVSLKGEAEFRTRFPRSAVRRARFDGFIRNVVIAIANSRQKCFLPLLDALGTQPVAKSTAVAEVLRWARRKLQG